MTEPHVTVGLPVCNDADGLRRTVPTIVEQTWRGPVRLIVVDDGSTDETTAALESLSSMYSGIEVVRNHITVGLPRALNTILERAGETYVAWAESGDLWSPRKVEFQLRALVEEERVAGDMPLLCAAPVRRASAHGVEVLVPDPAGDQLSQALAGGIPSDLATLLGHADVFRAGGGFDEHLLWWHDYDFVVRFCAAGGRIVTVQADFPLSTRVRFGAGPGPKATAAAARIISQKHRPYLARYGKVLERRVVAERYRRVADGYGRDRAVVRQIAWRTWASLVGRNRQHRSVDGAKRGWAAAQPWIRLIRRLMPGLHRFGIVDLARRLGLDNRLSGASSAGLSSARGRPAELTALQVTPGPDASVKAWLRLEDTYRMQGRRHSAQQVLDQALARHPAEPAILVRMLELTSLRRAWQQCIEVWEKFDAARSAATALTHARVARAYLAIGEPARAHEIASVGVGRWPDDPRLRHELFAARARLVDWSTAFAGTDGAPEGSRGAVVSLGFLVGDAGPVTGVVARPHTRSEIVMRLNGKPLLRTHAGLGRDAETRFSLACQDLLEYLGDGDVITVEFDGEPLPLGSYGSHLSCTTGYRSRSDELMNLLANGYVFTKFGALRQGHTSESKRLVLDLFEDVASVIAAVSGSTAFPCYGNLLGTIREHDFISHDVGGFDMAYLSEHDDPAEVRGEFARLCRELVRQGYAVTVWPWGTYVRRHRAASEFVDVSFAWLNEAGELRISFGTRHHLVTDRKRVLYPRQGWLAGRLVPVPGNAEEVLQLIYGPAWAVPDQGFNLEAGLERDAEFLLSWDEVESLRRLDADLVDVGIDGADVDER